MTSSVMARILSVRRPEFDGPDLIWSAGSQTCGRDGGDPDPATLLRASEDGKSHVTADTLDASHSEDDPGWLRGRARMRSSSSGTSDRTSLGGAGLATISRQSVSENPCRS